MASLALQTPTERERGSEPKYLMEDLKVFLDGFCQFLSSDHLRIGLHLERLAQLDVLTAKFGKISAENARSVTGQRHEFLAPDERAQNVFFVRIDLNQRHVLRRRRTNHRQRLHRLLIFPQSDLHQTAVIEIPQTVHRTNAPRPCTERQSMNERGHSVQK